MSTPKKLSEGDIIIKYLEEDLELVVGELQHYDTTIISEEMTVKEIEILMLRKESYKLKRQIKMIKRLIGKR